MMPEEADPAFSVPFTFVLYLLFLLSGFHFPCWYPLKSSLRRGFEDLMPPHTWFMQLTNRNKGMVVHQCFGDGIWEDPGFPVYGQNTRPWRQTVWIWTQAVLLSGYVMLGNYLPFLKLSSFIYNMWLVNNTFFIALNIKWANLTKGCSIVLDT